MSECHVCFFFFFSFPKRTQKKCSPISDEGIVNLSGSGQTPAQQVETLPALRLGLDRALKTMYRDHLLLLPRHTENSAVNDVVHPSWKYNENHGWLLNIFFFHIRTQSWKLTNDEIYTLRKINYVTLSSGSSTRLKKMKEIRKTLKRLATEDLDDEKYIHRRNCA